MSKHTKGPWTIKEIIDGLGFEIFGPNLELIARAHWDSKYNEELMANARLIAAAPDLLRELKATTNRLLTLGKRDSCAESQRATIERAIDSSKIINKAEAPK